MAHTGLFRFNGKCGFVKGSTRGQGKAIAIGLAQYGASPVQIDRDVPEKTTTDMALLRFKETEMTQKKPQQIKEMG